MLKEVGKQCLRRGAPARLAPEQKQLAHQEPQILQVSTRRDESSTRLRRLYTHINRAPADQQREHKLLCRKVISLRKAAEGGLRKKPLKGFHNTADLEQVLRQLKGESTPSREVVPPVHLLQERNQVAKMFPESMNETLFADLVTVLSFLNGRYEGSAVKRSIPLEKSTLSENKMPTDTYPTSPSSLPPLEKGTLSENMIPADASAALPADPSSLPGPRTLKPPRIILKVFPRTSTKLNTPPLSKKLTSRTCLICYGNYNREGSQPFSRSDGLRRHYRTVHFQYMTGPIFCPMESCETLINSPEHFFSHAATVHQSSLGTRARLQLQYSHPRLGVLMPFR